MSYRSVRSFRRVAVELAAALLLVAACSRGDAAGSSGKSAAAVASTASAAAPATVSAADSINARADRGRILGDSNAKVWLVMASDFQCPFCKQWHDSSFANIVQKYVKSGRVRMAYLNMPLSIHQFALPAAEAAMCASVQDKFWPMHDSLFATQRIWETLQTPASFFDTLANHNHVDMGPWRTCVSQHLTRPLIEADYDRARQTGVTSTPTFIVGTTKLASADADVAGALDAALAAKGK
jgi:protein-disulfide isomerase